MSLYDNLQHLNPEAFQLSLARVLETKGIADSLRNYESLGRIAAKLSKSLGEHGQYQHGGRQRLVLDGMTIMLAALAAYAEEAEFNDLAMRAGVVDPPMSSEPEA